MAAITKEMSPAVRDARNQGNVKAGFLNLSQKKTAIAGRAALSINRIRIQIPFMVPIYSRIISAIFIMYSVRIILVTGPKHSGKSLCAKALGENLGMRFIDLDDLVTEQNGKPPRELFVMGPEVFQKAEAQALASLIQNEGSLIVAAGGGLIDNSEAVALLSLPEAPSKTIITVYLDVSAKTAWQRIANDAESGGLSPFLNTDDPRETHLALHNRRAEAYKTIADIIILAEDKSPSDLALEIAGRLEELELR